MKLTVIERIRLLEYLPERGNLATMRMVRKLRESLEFTEEESGDNALRAFVLKGGKFEDAGALLKPGSLSFIVVEVPCGNGVTTSRYMWNKNEDTGKEIKFSNAGRQLILDTLNQLDKAGGITVDLLSLADKFMKEEDLPASLKDRIEAVPATAANGEEKS